MKRALKDNQEAFAGQEFYVGIDVHQKQWTISIQSNQMALAKPLTIDPSARSLSSYLKRQYPGGKYHAVYEAGYSGFWPARDLLSEKIETMVVNPADIPTMHKERSTKTDSVDSRKLARSLENKELRAIYIPERKAEEYRLLNQFIYRRSIGVRWSGKPSGCNRYHFFGVRT